MEAVSCQFSRSGALNPWSLHKDGTGYERPLRLLSGGLSAQECPSICDLWLLLLFYNNFYLIRKATCHHRDVRDCSKSSRQIEQALGMPLAGFGLPPGRCEAHGGCLGLLGIRKPRTTWHLCGRLWYPCHSSWHSPEHSLTLSRSSQTLYKDNSSLQKFHLS